MKHLDEEDHEARRETQLGDDNTYLVQCLQGVSHWTGCSEEELCMRCQRDRLALRVEECKIAARTLLARMDQLPSVSYVYNPEREALRAVLVKP